ncbi:MAG: putative thioredoxin [Candidatus Azotimanducaceae bacterium]|jgi:putative thioredoxin
MASLSMNQLINPSSSIIDITAQNFQEVIEQSRETPVLLEFYIEGAEQCQPLALLLNKLVTEYQGKFLLGRIEVQQNPQVAQQLGIKGLPTVKVIFQGQMVQDLEGPQEEATLRDIIDQITMSPVERIQEQIQVLLEQGDRTAAIELLQQVIEQEPANHALQVELADLLIMDNRSDEARQIIAALPAETDGINKPVKRLNFIDKAAELPPLVELENLVISSPDDLQVRYQLAVRLVVDDQIEVALEHLLVVMQKDREFEEQLARKTMIDVFELLGKGDPVATAYRRKMFAFLH